VEIQIDENLVGVLERLAAGQNTDAQTFASRILKSYLRSQYVNEIKEKIGSIETDKLAKVDAAIELAKKDEPVG
jgi:hypothetical protein